MSKEKQIEEMAKVIERTGMLDSFSRCEIVAKDLCDEGYRKQGEWISVDERLPKEGVDVLVTLKIGDRVSVDTDRIYSGRWFGYSPMRGVSYVTHWMPFPEPPEVVVR